MIKKLCDRVHQLILNMKIYYKLISFIIGIGMLPIIIFSVTSYQQTQKRIERELFQSSQQFFNQYVEGIQFKLSIYENLMWGIAVNNTIQEALSEADQWKQKNVTEVYEKISMNVKTMYQTGKISGIYNVKIYSLNPSFPRDGHNVSNISAIDEEVWRENIDMDSKKTTTFHYQVPQKDQYVVSIVSPVVNMKSKTWESIALLKMDIILQSLFGINPEVIAHEKNGLYIFDNKDELMYFEGDQQYKDDEMDMIRQLMISKRENEFEYVLDNGDVVFYKEIRPYGWKIAFITHYFSIYETMEGERNGVIAYGVIASLLLILITILFSKLFSARIQILNQKMLKVQNGDLEITEIIEGTDEIGEIDAGFNRTIEEIKSLIRQNYIQKLEKREAELIALQFQINPHFLYNTLESINYIAEIYECKEISIMSQKLGDMFRYSLNKDSEEFVMLYQEENHIRNYIDIQNIRFEDKYEIITNINEDVGKCKVLKFILQPIVENSVTYGFTKMNKGYIKMNASIKEEQLIITVEDNGMGMEQDVLEKINDLINDMSFNLSSGYQKSIGLRNVNLRIKMAYGNDYGIQIESSKGRGTRVIYKLPVCL
ncbi:sensor histidine kinase [Vallitalea okinawensis]|uniref:sensor histidine kinase n=1 Tax=Vallitalea okinawensis TaxID=2078660 RepID=UPI000CFD76A5|nr:histidine kinase [Vallitalea okinawensis]